MAELDDLNPDAMRQGAIEDAAEPQSRDDRIELLAAAFLEGERHGGGRIRIEFLGINPPPFGVTGCTITLEDLPGGLVMAGIAVGLGSVVTGSWWNDSGGAHGRPSYSDRHRNRALKAAGWQVDTKARRSIEVAPGDRTSVAAVVDAIQSSFDACASVPGAPPVPGATWAVRNKPERRPRDGTSGAGLKTDPVPADEAWVEDATEADLRSRLVTLAGLRGGRVVVRVTHAAYVELDLTARRRGDRIEVRARDPMTSWKATWSMPVDAPRADTIIEDLRDAVAGYDDGSGSLSVRLEQHDAAASWRGDTGYLFALGWAAALAGVALLSLGVRPSGAGTWLGILDGIFAEDGGAIAGAFAVLITSMLPAMAASAGAESLAAARGWSFDLSQWVSVGASAIATVAYLVVLIAADTAFGLVIAAPWAAIVVVVVAGRIRDRGAATGSSRRA